MSINVFQMKSFYDNYTNWHAHAFSIGWIHVHDDLVVCDDPADVCIGEWSDDDNRGWIILDPICK